MEPIPKPLLGVRVLLVDDDASARELIGLMLEGAGAEVRAASDAKEAVRTILQWVPTIVLSDLAMPTMDGFTLLREVRSIDQLRQIPAIAVTGMSDEKARQTAFAAGFQAHVTKPVDPQKLIAIVAQWAVRANYGPTGEGAPPRPSPLR